jgi:hypothetical protein
MENLLPFDVPCGSLDMEQKMAERARRTHTAVFKAKGALAREKTLTELAQRFEVRPTRLSSGNGG